MSISRRLAVIVSKFFLVSLIITPNFWTDNTHPYPGAIFLKIDSFIPESEEMPPPKIKVIG